MTTQHATRQPEGSGLGAPPDLPAEAPPDLPGAPPPELPGAPPLAPPGAARHSVHLKGDVISYLEWPAGGAAHDRPALLLHGLQSTALTMTRVAEGLAERGWQVVAPDLPGHGYSYALDGSDADRPGPLDLSRLRIFRLRLSRRHRLRSTASLVAELARRLGIEHPLVVGHSWGASVAAVLESAGLAPSRLVLVDPPFVTAKQARTLGMGALAEPTDSYAAARETLLADRPDWHPMDLAAKAEALTRVSTQAMVAVVAANVPFDPLPALVKLVRRHPEVPVAVISGEPGRGSYVSREGLNSLKRLLGDEHVLVMRGAGHSPHRTHYPEFMPILLRELGDSPE